MFSFFKKKEAKSEQPVKAAPVSDSPARDEVLTQQLEQLCGSFSGATMELCAVTGPIGFTALPRPDENRDGPWLIVLPLTAWYEGDGIIVQGKAHLYATADAKLLAHLRRMAPRDGIIQVDVRKGEKDNTYWMQALPTPFMDPDLKAILLEQVKEVSTDVDGLGHFILDRSTGFFLGDVNWLGEDLPMSYPNAPEQTDVRAAQDTGRALLADAQGWNDKAMQAGESAFRAAYPDEDTIPALEISSIDLGPDGSFTFWFGSEEIVEPLCAQGNLSRGDFLPPEEFNIN